MSVEPEASFSKGNCWHQVLLVGKLHIMRRDQVGDGHSLLNFTHALVSIAFYRQVAALLGGRCRSSAQSNGR